jgi:hypothetical protein
MPETKPTKECTRLQRLRWGMMLSPLLLLVPYEAYKLLVIGIRWHEVLLDVLVVMAGSFALTQLAFSIAFRLHDRNIRRQERLEILHRVDAELSASLDQEQVLEAVLEGALRLTSSATTPSGRRSSPGGNVWLPVSATRLTTALVPTASTHMWCRRASPWSLRTQ